MSGDSDGDDETLARGNYPPASLAWRLFFGLNCFFVVVNILSIPLLPSVGVIEIVDFTFTNVMFIGLCGFIFRKPLGSVVFWRYFFYANIMEAMVVLLIFPIAGVNLYGEPMTFNLWLLNIMNTFGNLLALNLYAYKMHALWAHKSN